MADNKMTVFMQMLLDVIASMKLKLLNAEHVLRIVLLLCS